MRYDDDFFGFKPYVTFGSRRAQAARELATLTQKGRTVAPVVIAGRKIAATFWGEAWCDNLERYSDYANRLPRGRTYVRNGSVVDLQIQPGRVAALVSGSTMYEVSVTVGPVAQARWKAICTDCSGAIDSLVELLQGRFSKAVMARLCHDGTGLFPSPQDIHFTCSCPDWASMCKHVAAVLYGIGARLDHQPELLFTLRKVDQQDLIASAGADLSKTRQRPGSAKLLADDNLAEMFGIDMAPASPARPPVNGVSNRATAAGPVAAVPKRKRATPAAKPKQPASTSKSGKQGLTARKRLAIAARMRKHWAELKARAQTKKRKVSKSS
jgi:uncharacterized Zn finger protein